MASAGAPKREERGVVNKEAAEPSGRILLVDDEEPVLQVTRLILEHFGFTVLQAQSGEEALALLDSQAKELRLVILDLTMPGIGGLEVYRRLRERLAEVPILLSSGHAANSLPPELVKQKHTGFLQKPYQSSELIGKVREMLDAST
jgi:CheY-like chemotaxis protein